MERVGILVNKLQEHLQQQGEYRNADTSTMLYTELLQEKEKLNGHGSAMYSFSAKQSSNILSLKVRNLPDHEVKTEAPVPVIEEKQPAVSTESVVIEEMPKVETVVEEKQKVDLPHAFVYNEQPEIKQPSNWAFDPVEIPTLAHQKKIVYELHEEVDDNNSLNDKLKEEKQELGALYRKHLSGI
jgi:hypothetical protein